MLTQLLFLDTIAIGFGTLAVLFPILCIGDGEYGLDEIIVTGYYGFFCLFFLGIIIRQRHIMEYCAFVNSLWIKSLFYIFCTSLAFSKNMILCWIVGSCFAVGAVLNVVRCCGGQDDINAGQK